jgi:hypothetical protein
VAPRRFVGGWSRTPVVLEMVYIARRRGAVYLNGCVHRLNRLGGQEVWPRCGHFHASCHCRIGRVCVYIQIGTLHRNRSRLAPRMYSHTHYQQIIPEESQCIATLA